MTMKSIKESLGLVRTGSIIEGMPKSAVGLLSTQEERALYNLWTEIIKAEEAYTRLTSETGKYCSSLREIHSTEEKLLKLLGESNIGIHSSTLCQLIDEYLSVAVEIKKISDETAQVINEVMGASPEQYHALYEHLNAFRKKRDSYIGEIEKCQDKLDRLKLKGKRTTDVIVEKEKNLRQFSYTNSCLVAEGEHFHKLRIDGLQSCVQALVHSEINYYGSVTSEYNKYIQLGRGANHMKEQQYMATMNSHLDKIKNLTIVDN